MNWKLTKRLIVIGLLLVLVGSCNKDDENVDLESAIAVSVGKVLSNRVVISWNTINTTNDALYKIVLNNEVVAEALSGKKYILTTLSESTSYKGTMFLLDKNGNTAFTSFSFTTPKDTSPGKIKITEQKYEGSDFTISWDKSVDVEGDSIRYRVIFDEYIEPEYTGQAGSFKRVLSDTTNDLTYAFKNLEKKKRYRITLIAIDGTDMESASTFVEVPRLDNQPPAPVNLSFDDTNFPNVIVSWDPVIDPEGGAISYRVDVGEQFLESLLDFWYWELHFPTPRPLTTTSDTTFTFVDLDAFSPHTFRIVAVDSNENISDVSRISFVPKQSGTYDGGLSAEDQIEVNVFQGHSIKKFAGDISIYVPQFHDSPLSDYGYPSSVSDLSPLKGIREIGGNLTLGDIDGGYNLDFSDITPFEDVVNVQGDFFIGGIQRAILPDFNGLSVGGSIEISNIKELKEIKGFGNIQTIDGNLTLSDHIALESILGFSNLEIVKGDVEILNSSMLNSIEGLRGIKKITGNLKIVNNSNLLVPMDFINSIDIGGTVEINNNK